MGPTFLNELYAGRQTKAGIDDWINHWHEENERAGRLAMAGVLWKHLGLTWAEWMVWGRTGKLPTQEEHERARRGGYVSSTPAVAPARHGARIRSDI